LGPTGSDDSSATGTGTQRPPDRPDSAFGTSYRSAFASAVGPTPRKIVAWVRSGRGVYTHARCRAGTLRRNVASRAVASAISATLELDRYNVRAAGSSAFRSAAAESTSAPPFHQRLGSSAMEWVNIA